MGFFNLCQRKKQAPAATSFQSSLAQRQTWRRENFSGEELTYQSPFKSPQTGAKRTPSTHESEHREENFRAQKSCLSVVMVMEGGTVKTRQTVHLTVGALFHVNHTLDRLTQKTN